MKKRYSLALSCILASVMYAGCDNGSGIKVDVDECTGEGCGSTEPVAKTCTGGKQWCESDKECFDLKMIFSHPSTEACARTVCNVLMPARLTPSGGGVM